MTYYTCQNRNQMQILHLNIPKTIKFIIKKKTNNNNNKTRVKKFINFKEIFINTF